MGQETQKQGGVNLTDLCKIRFLMAGSQRLVLDLLGRRLGARGGRRRVAHRAAGHRPVQRRPVLPVASTLNQATLYRLLWAQQAQQRALDEWHELAFALEEHGDVVVEGVVLAHL